MISIIKKSSPITNPIVTQNLEKYGFPKPIFYQSLKKKWIIFSTPAPIYNNKNGIYMYDISNNFWIFFVKYPHGIKLKHKYKHVLDNQSNILYIFDAKFRHMAALNLKTKKWTVQKIISRIGLLCLYNCEFTFVVSPNKQIHALSNNGYHFKYDIQKAAFVPLPPYDATGFNFYKIFYVESIRCILALSVFDAKIMYYKLNRFDDHENNMNSSLNIWRKYPLKLPCMAQAYIYDVSLIYDHILLIRFYSACHDDKIYCVDLRYDNIIQAVKLFGFDNSSAYFMIDSHDGMMHAFNKSKHFECRHNFIPKQWHDEYRRTFDKMMVIGYVNTCQHVNVPQCILDLVWLYYPGYLTYTV